MRSKWSIVTALWGILAPAGFCTADGGVLLVSSSEAASGELVDVSILLNGTKEVGALDALLSFDPLVLSFIEADVGESTANGMIIAKEVEPGKLRVALVDADGLSSTGEVLRIRFRAAEGAGGTTELVIASAAAYHVKKLVALPIKVVDGTVTFSAARAGTATEDTGLSMWPAGSDWLWALPIATIVVIGLIIRRRRSSASRRRPVGS